MTELMATLLGEASGDEVWPGGAPERERAGVARAQVPAPPRNVAAARPGAGGVPCPVEVRHVLGAAALPLEDIGVRLTAWQPVLVPPATPPPLSGWTRSVRSKTPIDHAAELPVTDAK